MRLEGPSEWLWEQYPAEFLDIALFVTDLGDVTVLMLLLSMLYWLADRRKSAVLVSYAVVGISVILLLKTGFAMPRPEVEIVAREYDQYGFPSGHAFSSVIVYGGALWIYDRYRNLRVALPVVALITAISVSRVVIGVHYLADIIAGAVAGLMILASLEIVTNRDPRRGFAIGAVLAIPTVLLTSGEATTLAFVGFGTALGGLAGTARLEAIPELRSRREGLVLSVCGLVYVGIMIVLESVLVADQSLLSAVFFAVLTAGILLAPLFVARTIPETLVIDEPVTSDSPPN